MHDRCVAVGDLTVDCDSPAQIDGPHEGLEGQDIGKSAASDTAFDDYHKPDRVLLPDHTVGERQAPHDSRRNSLDVWGLTGWFLNVFMWRMGFWRDVEDAGGKTLEVEQPGRGSQL
jgi:hypothetical protein